jgi:hypothetical protein
MKDEADLHRSLSQNEPAQAGLAILVAAVLTAGMRLISPQN